jgi:peptidase M49-like protein
LPGANFYPEDMTRQEFEAWVKGLPKDARQDAEGFFTVIRRDSATKHLKAVPYSQVYKADLEKSARLLEQAAALTDNASLKKFLTTRAAAFRSNDYYESDLAWMDLDAPIDITIGPYETYNDELFGYKAAYEAYVNLRDDAETAKLKFFGDHLQEVENNLPIDPKFRNPKLGSQAPIRVVNEIFAAADGAHGVQTAAYNLPNDERVITQKGSKRVMLKNVQEAKFHSTLEPISKRVLMPSSQSSLSFDSFFSHILAHELSHGIGPHQISVGGRNATPRQELKELYSAIEEAKADVTGLFMLQHLADRKLVPGGSDMERKLYTTFLASTFRTLRFGLKDAHGKGMALQVNYLTDKGAIVARPDARFDIDFDKIKSAVRDLDRDLLMLEATGDYAGAKRMLDQLGVVRPEMQKALNTLNDIPVDIEPVYVTAHQTAP